MPCSVEVNGVVHDVIDAPQLAAHADGPGDGRPADAQHPLDLVEELQRLAPVPVQLVHEGHDRSVPQPADLHQLDGTLLDALGRVDDHQRGVDGGQRAVGVLREVRVTRGVQEVHHPPPVRELHHGGGDGDPPLLLHLHPVRGGVTRSLARLDRPGHLDRAPEQQELLGQGRLAGVGVRDDGEGAAAGGFVDVGGHGGSERRSPARGGASRRSGSTLRQAGVTCRA